MWQVARAERVDVAWVMVAGGERNLLLGTAGNVVIFVHGLKEPLDEEWQDSVNQLAAQADTIKGILVFSLGGGPNSSQRKYLAEMWKRRGAMLPTALLTPSSVVRGMVTALNWLVPKPLFRTFTPDQVQEAVRYLQLNEEETGAAQAKIVEFRAALGVADQSDRMKAG